MNRYLYRSAIAIVALFVAASCLKRNPKISNQNKGEDVKEINPTAVIDSLKSGETYRLCTQVVTSDKYLWNITDTTYHYYDREKTPYEKAFYFPKDELNSYAVARLFGTRYNFAAVMNHVVHCYELFCRKSSEMEIARDNDSTLVITKADTLALIKEDIISIPVEFLSLVLVNDKDRKAAVEFLAAYSRFDGDDSEESAFSKAFSAYNNYFSTMPRVASDELLDEFEENFWEWYDKKNYVPGIDEIQKLRVMDKVELSDEQMAHFRQAVESETDIDRRTILALEYAKWDEWGGVTLLGEILESGQYTRYLLETWITWRASIQMSRIGPSSFCVIPNNYYDQIRVKCLETMLRHLIKSDDKYEPCMIENLIMCQILHRMASIAGNESLKTLADLQYGMFVHPRVLGD